MASGEMEISAYMDASHPSNKIRPRVRCWGCRALGCVGKHWGNWCFECNKKRIGRINGQVERVLQRLEVNDD